MAKGECVLGEEEYNRSKLSDHSKRQSIQKLSRLQQPFGNGGALDFDEAVSTAGAFCKSMSYHEMQTDCFPITVFPGVVNWLAFRASRSLKSVAEYSDNRFHLIIDDKEVMTNTFGAKPCQFVLIGSATILPKPTQRQNTDSAIITFQPIKFYESIKFGITSKSCFDIEVAYNCEEYNYE